MQSFLKEKTNKSGGSAGGGGYNYQATAIAYVCSHILLRQPLGWLFHTKDLPVKVASETGGPGDDLDIYLEDNTHIEVQVKHGLRKNGDFWATLLNLSKGIANDSNLHAVLLLDTTTSLTIRYNLRNDLTRLAEGRDDEHEPSYTNENSVVQPSPRKYLLLVLAKLKNLTINELLEYYSDIRPDVHEAATEASIKILESNKVELANVLRRISQEEIPSSILKKILDMPSSVLQDVKGDIVNLLKSSNKDIRWIVTSNLCKNWINKEDAIRLTTKMLRDEDSEIRNCATKTLRVLTS